MLEELIISMRPKHWYKNLVIFAGIVFSTNILNYEMWIDVIVAFSVFCILSGCGYIINDFLDRENDKKHPRKRKRPIASGKLKSSHALAFAAVLIFVAISGAYLINIQFLITSIIYLLIVLSCSEFLKHIIIVDILVISIGFVIRAIAGCLAINVFISPWLIICTFLLALFLALGKRRHEFILLGDNAKDHRKILEGYSSEMLDQMTTITIAMLIMSYSLYTFLTGNIYMMATIPLVIYGVFRYLFLIYVKNFGGEPEMLFRDRGMSVCLVLWTVMIILILYGSPHQVIRYMEGIGY